MIAARKTSGFTLIEVLVALAILAVALAAAARAASVATTGAEDTRLRALATWVAQNRIAELQAINAFPTAGRASGRSSMGGAEFEWQQLTSETPNAAFRKITVTVMQPGATQTLVTINSFVVRPPGSSA
jgi:general secretion pathway protein I